MSTSKMRRPIQRRLAKDWNVKEYGLTWRIPSRNSYQSDRDGPAASVAIAARASAPPFHVKLCLF
jgi:hypothetical protein